VAVFATPNPRMNWSGSVRVVGDPEGITRAPCWELRSAIPNEMIPWLGLQLEGLHYAQTGVIEQD
jgi:hypothetical protein